MEVILLHSNHQYISATRVHARGGENKNTVTIIMCPNHSMVKKKKKAYFFG